MRNAAKCVNLALVPDLPNENLYAELLDVGWHRRDDGMVVHPADEDVNVWRHPYTGQVLLSPKLVELLKSLAPVINSLHNPEPSSDSE